MGTAAAQPQQLAIMAAKRKAVTRDPPEADEVALSEGGSDVDFPLLDGTLAESDESEPEELEPDGELEDSADEGSGEFTDENEDDDSEDEGSEEDGSDIPNYTITADANGNPRYIYKEIDPVYDSDDSDGPETTNTIGNIPLSFYDSYPHIGYDIDGKKIARPAKGEALDALLDSIDIPEGYTGLVDPSTGKPLELSKQELDLIRRLQLNEIPEVGFDPYPATVEYFTSKTEIMPLSAAPEPKRRFIPSKHEAKRIMKIVKAIREGRIQPYKPPEEREEKDETVARYDLWANETPRPDNSMHIPAPKLAPPLYDESYHPPPEYLPDDKEKKEWQETDPEDRTKDYLPTDHSSLRNVRGYDKFLNERFYRCLDLYLAPRIRRNKLNIDPESLLPKLPEPDELRPFPTVCQAIFRHEGKVRSCAIDPTGIWLATGGDDGSVRIWELESGYQLRKIKLDHDEPVHVVRWRPTKETAILAACAGENIFMIVPASVGKESYVCLAIQEASKTTIDAGWGYAANPTSNGAPQKVPAAQWTRPGTRLEDNGVLLKIAVRSPVKVLSWHRRGDYFVTVSPRGQSSSVIIHNLSKHHSQLPFRRQKGLAQFAQFHPSKPIIFVATQLKIRMFDLSKLELLRTITPGAKWISSFDVHPGGDNLIVGTYDKRLLWHDLELSAMPYKTLRYHQKGIRSVKFHQGLPLFADASDDGTMQIFHGKVVSDLMDYATIVPVHRLRGHEVKSQLGVMDIDWHPTNPWVVSAAADGTCRLWA